ncbi:hypothetical protein [Aerococcus loyolae]|uniref:DUF4367 domain-containing protein n=1 Tax=Aerococcus loyolae TaxID=2976809 RepID=A0ABT4C031_9LACT|nr:hypothetical protein [Aerococcus loyolae]MCY3024923.1 hypothetical protein [Aerococcus loyolae]MCY3027021.1 hypothetical protein [Aerococcus loyolae]MCY3028605.1 hypothetical protein [Aerococcus loyolae]OAM70558.1 hypothetical protein A1D21_02840 [Aerococcus loyolae]
MPRTAILVIILSLSLLSMLILIGLIIYRKIKNKSIKYFSIATLASLVIAIICFVAIGTSGINPNDPLSTKLEIARLFGTDYTDIVVTDEERHGEIYKQYNFGDEYDTGIFMNVDYDETEVLDIHFSGANKYTILDVLDEINYPVTGEMIKVFDEGGSTFNSMDNIGILIWNHELNLVPSGTITMFVIAFDEEQILRLEEAARIFED